MTSACNEFCSRAQTVCKSLAAGGVALLERAQRPPYGLCALGEPWSVSKQNCGAKALLEKE
jgi:hypothetical protein